MILNGDGPFLVLVAAVALLGILGVLLVGIVIGVVLVLWNDRRRTRRPTKVDRLRLVDEAEDILRGGAGA